MIDAINMGNYETCGYRHLSFPDPVVASACHFAPALPYQTDAAISWSCNRHRRRRDSTGTAENRTLTGNSISKPRWARRCLKAAAAGLSVCGLIQIGCVKVYNGLELSVLHANLIAF